MGNGSQPVSAEHIQTLSRKVNNLVELLRRQSDILQRRGMSIPSGALQSMETMLANLENLGPRITEQNNELEQLRTLSATTSVISSTLDLDKSLHIIMDTILQLTGAERGYIMLKNTETDEFEVRFAHGMEEKEADDEHDSITVSRTIVEEVARTAEPVLTTNAQHDRRFAGQQSIMGYNLRSILAVPLLLKGTVQGVVYVDNRVKAGIFGRKELQLLTAVAGQAALAIENARLFEQARATLEEITQIKTLLDNILASIASGVITTDANECINVFNDSAEAILRLPEQQVLGYPFAEALKPIYEHVSTYLTEVRTRDQSFTLEADVPIEQQEVHNFNIKLSALKDGNDHIEGVALVVDDMTELKRRDKMLEAVRRYLPPAMVDNIRSIEKIGLAGERRDITVLFVEVRPFNTFPANLKASELMQMLNLYMTTGTEAIHRRAGVIDKYMGSEIMGLFNTQLNPSNTHAWDAVQAALDMAAEFQELYRRLGETPALPYYRIGVHTGIATLGNVGGSNRREFSAIGDTVNLAKRLQENATSGELIISQETYDSCKLLLDSLPFVKVVQRSPLHVKGRLQAANIYQIQLH